MHNFKLNAKILNGSVKFLNRQRDSVFPHSFSSFSNFTRSAACLLFSSENFSFPQQPNEIGSLNVNALHVLRCSWHLLFVLEVESFSSRLNMSALPLDVGKFQYFPQ